MANQQFSAMLFLAASGSFNWTSDSISLAVVNNYTFDVSHDTMAAVVASGARVIATGRVLNRFVDTDGSLKSADVSIPKVPAGTYSIILMDDRGLGTVHPLVYFDTDSVGQPITSATSGDFIFRPHGGTDGVWGTL